MKKNLYKRMMNQFKNLGVCYLGQHKNEHDARLEASTYFVLKRKKAFDDEQDKLANVTAHFSSVEIVVIYKIAFLNS